MVIVVITAAISTFSNYRLDMVKAFRDSGNQVIVLGDEDSTKWSCYFESMGMGYASYHVSRNGVNPIQDLRTELELKAILRDLKADKVWTYQAKPNIYGNIAAAKVGIAEVYAMMGGLGSVFRATDAKNQAIKRIVAFEYKRAFRTTKKVFFQNPDDRDLFRTLGIIRDDQIVMTKGSGVNLQYFEKKPIPINENFLFVGRLVKGKGVVEFLKAAEIVKAKYPNVTFSVVGPFDTNPTALQPKQLQSYIDNRIIDYYGEQDDVRPFLEACTCFVLPSYYGEGTPKSGLEAMATGRPLIVANAVGCREVVKEGQNGFLVEPHDANDLAKKMIILINDRNLAEEMGQKSRQIAEAEFDVRDVNSVIMKAMGIA